MKTETIRHLLIGVLGVVMVTAAVALVVANPLHPGRGGFDRKIVTAESSSPGQVMPDGIRR